MSIQEKEQIRIWVDEDAAITLNNLKHKVLEVFDKSVGKTTIDRCLRDFHYTMKSLIAIPIRRNVPSTIQSRYDYAERFNQMFLEINDNKFIFIDEVGFSVCARTKKGRSAVGTLATISVPAVKSKNISMVAAVNKYEIINYKINNGPVNGENFKNFLLSLHTKLIEKRIENPIYIMDNARIHHYHGLDSIIQEKNLNILYLPPYSPFLNIIENVFSKWKNNVKRSNPNSVDELFTAINNSMELITTSDCMGYFQHMLKYVSISLRREEINE